MSRFYSLSLATAAALVFAGPAQAHAKLVSSAPAASATVANQTVIQLTFDTQLVPALSGADVAMTGMPGMANHRPMMITGLKTMWSGDGKTLTLVAGRAFPLGTYKVTWHATGSDTHRVEGSFSFSAK